jgi:hypothetical protein
MNRRGIVRSALLVAVMAVVSLVLAVVGDIFAPRYGISTPGLLLWQRFHPVGSTGEPYMSGLWATILVDGLCWLIVLALLSSGVYAAVRVVRASSRRPGPNA